MTMWAVARRHLVLYRRVERWQYALERSATELHGPRGGAGGNEGTTRQARAHFLSVCKRLSLGIANVLHAEANLDGELATLFDLHQRAREVWIAHLIVSARKRPPVAAIVAAICARELDWNRRFGLENTFGAQRGGVLTDPLRLLERIVVGDLYDATITRMAEETVSHFRLAAARRCLSLEKAVMDRARG